MMSGQAEPVLSMVHVSATIGDERFADVTDVSFAVSAGECVSIALGDRRDSPLPGLAIGERISQSPASTTALHLPSAEAKSQGFLRTDNRQTGMSGRILFEGVSWEYRSTYGLLANRGKIGWVVSQPAWVNNLNLLENVLLRPLHHTKTPRAELLAQAQELAYAVGLPEVPAGRMSTIETSKLRRAEWVRAFLGRPSLLLLHRAFGGIEPTHYPALAKVAADAKARGAAIVWLADPGDELNAANRLADRRYQMVGANLVSAEAVP